jgi:hypothetical protein
MVKEQVQDDVIKEVDEDEEEKEEVDYKEMENTELPNPYSERNHTMMPSPTQSFQDRNGRSTNQQNNHRSQNISNRRDTSSERP